MCCCSRIERLTQNINKQIEYFKNLDQKYALDIFFNSHDFIIHITSSSQIACMIKKSIVCPSYRILQQNTHPTYNLITSRTFFVGPKTRTNTDTRARERKREYEKYGTKSFIF